MLGSCPKLGKWEPAKSYFFYLNSCYRNKLTWTDGHNWKGYIPARQLDESFEYKYVIQESSTQSVKKWEGGFNRKISVNAIQQMFDTPEIAEAIHKTEEYKFTYQNIKMIYSAHKMQLIILDSWQS